MNGRVYEAIVAGIERRRRCDIYHAALIVTLPEAAYVVEMAPIRDGNGAERGVVSEGPVGSALLRGLRLFRYEVRRWPGGEIPDLAEAVDSPQRLTDDPETARRLLELTHEFPTAVWNTGWNSNSLVAWLIVRSGLDVGAVRIPAGGRAPGWDQGVLSGRAASAAQARPRRSRRGCSGSRPSRTRATSGGSPPRAWPRPR